MIYVEKKNNRLAGNTQRDDFSSKFVKSMRIFSSDTDIVYKLQNWTTSNVTELENLWMKSHSVCISSRIGTKTITKPSSEDITRLGLRES